MKIAVVVQGRFHAFELANALLRRDHDVTVFTNYPKWAVARFGLPTSRVRSFWAHGVLSRVADRVADWTGMRAEPVLNPAFGRWASKQLAKEHWDVIHGWSGISEEIFERHPNTMALNLIMRGSAHIRVQDALLRDEEQRTGVKIERPSEWLQAREGREYKLADRIVVLSMFARDSFVAAGEDPARLRLLPLGVDVKAFKPARGVIEERCRRILSGQPLRVLYVGAVSCRKGLWDIRAIVRRLAPAGVSFRFVGNITSDSKAIVRELQGLAEFVPRQPQADLAKWYAESDLFLFPTIEDGFAVVLAQAQANGLPILTTTNCSGPDLVRHGESGWIFPVRNPDAFIKRLQWCDDNRPALAAMVRRLSATNSARTWDEVAWDFERICHPQVTEQTPAALVS